MSVSPVLVFHISAGAIGLLSGGIALSLRKGSRSHRLAGKVFVIAMLSMTVSAVYLAIMKQQTGNCLIALLTFYLVITAWMTARRRNGETGLFELGALLAALALAAGLLFYALAAANTPTGSKDGHPALKYLIFGLVALFSAAGDMRMLMRGGVAGAHRVARHLWRMSLPLLISANTFFQGQAKLFPAGLRRTQALYAPIILIMVVMAFWMIRVLFAEGKLSKLQRQSS